MLLAMLVRRARPGPRRPAGARRGGAALQLAEVGVGHARQDRGLALHDRGVTERLVWELSPEGAPHCPGPAVVSTAVIIATTILGLAGETWLHPLGGWRLPALLPVGVAAAALGLYGLALWRSTTWSVGSAGLLRLRGVFFRRAAPLVPRQEVTAAHFAGLPPATAAALADAVRRGVEPGPLPEGGRRPLVALVALVAALVGSGHAIERRHVALRERFHVDAGAVGPAVTATSLDLEPELLAAYRRRVAADPTFSPEARAVALERAHLVHGPVKVTLEDGAPLQGNRYELDFSLRAPGSSLAADDERLRLRLELARPACVPLAAGPVVVRLQRGPDAERFLDLLEPRLAAAGLTLRRQR